MKIKKYFYTKYTAFSLSVVFMILSLILLSQFILYLGDSINTLSLGVMLRSNVIDNDLNLPYPTFNLKLSGYDNIYDYIYDNFNTSITSYRSYIERNFIYEANMYDCKYWSYIHTIYYTVNREKHNYNMKYITTNNHIFVMIYNDSGYCMLEQDLITCFGEGME